MCVQQESPDADLESFRKKCAFGIDARDILDEDYDPETLVYSSTRLAPGLSETVSGGSTLLVIGGSGLV